ncbi:MAG: dihydrofolate reductase [Ignavibacteriaceae bacterium]
MKKIIISAVAQNGVIGKSSGEIPWHSKEEFQHFKNTTSGFPVIMGRKTFDTLGKPLKNRLNIVLTRNKKLILAFTEIVIFDSLHSAYKYCESKDYEKIFVIGGTDIYKQAMNTADELLISYMKFNAEGDVFFPEIDLKIWEVKRIDGRNEFDIYTYVRKI